MFARFVARMEDTRLPMSVIFGELVWWGARVAWGKEKKVDRVSPERSRSFQLRPVYNCIP